MCGEHSDKQSDLVRTLEKIIHSDSLKHVDEEMYLHPKTVIQRKQRIEKILGSPWIFLKLNSN